MAPTSFDLYNIGCGHDLTISELAKMIASIVGFNGEIIYDKTKPNGTMRKLLDSTRISSLGWKPKIEPKIGLETAYNDFLAQLKNPDLSNRH